ncbi:trypsin inhibitor [Aethina tumida]|uniref:trypsin inhibitor n=1 Tax=Aethina tumida TaxID=116153 RepID=UPI00096B5802|nr:trypsin inhibitor [Aethina tumida]
MSKLLKYLIVLVLIVHMECSSFQLSDCRLGPTVSSRQCKGLFPRYFWNDDTQECEEVIYGGCRPTKNNFLTMEECISIAKPVCYNLLR